VKLLIEGRPGSGKTTVVRGLLSVLREDGAPVTGFTTAEIRTGRSRIGFSIETVDGNKGVLAHVDYGGPRVGKYGVDVYAFDDLALPALEVTDEKTIVVIDELGKMELLSDAFRRSVESLFDGANDLIATVHAHKHPFTDVLKQAPNTEILGVTKANRDGLPRDIATRLLSHRRARVEDGAAQ
jgi:nucleoside-triphosphatase